MSDTPPERVRVTGPPRRPTTPRRAGTGEIDAGTPVGAIYMGSLLREQGWLAVRILVLLTATVGILPLAFHVFPDLAAVRLGGVPLSWLLIGFLVYPWLVVLGWRYVRAAEANERDFAALVEEVER
ncbi:hypothetical protein [uncultured Nocardioides sp.]|uniref:Uncharacterized protein n=1 Tax=uncultured Nocardioides sp. TaxID=198441 RepID=A0A6J4PLP4_9ACTN|nr:hypothetical protein [uncultured Nocardioides sp.]CAA9418897.1 MAG: FIG00994049: hypothetical protein [uncultured Nocardioides sp.]